MKINNKSIIITIYFSLLLVSCNRYMYRIGNQDFSSTTAAYEYQKSFLSKQIENIKRCKYFGSSIMIQIPPDEMLQQSPFVTGMPSQDELDFYLGFFKIDYKGIEDAFHKSKMFASVKSIQISGYLRYAHDHGFRYLFVNNGDLTCTIHDLLLNKDKNLRFPRGLDNLTYLVEDAISQFETSRSSANLYRNYKPVNEQYKYDDKTRKGYISVLGKGLAARSWMLQTIGDICASKNIAMKTGEDPSPGTFIILDEELINEKFTIYFESLY